MKEKEQEYKVLQNKSKELDAEMNKLRNEKVCAKNSSISIVVKL